MLKVLALSAVLALPLITGGCSSMMGDTASASNVSRDSAGAGALPGGAVAMPGAPATVGTSGNKNP